MYGAFSVETTEWTVVYGVKIRFWPTLRIYSTPTNAAYETTPTDDTTN